MTIYRIFDTFITMYTYTKGCYNTGNFEVLHSNAKLYAAAVLSGVGVWAILELLLGFGLYAMAKKRNFEKRYMAFIPFVNMLYAGRIAGETRLFGQRMKHAGVFVMAAQIIAANSTCLAGTSPDAVSRWGLPDFDSSVSRPASVPRMPSE